MCQHSSQMASLAQAVMVVALMAALPRSSIAGLPAVPIAYTNAATPGYPVPVPNGFESPAAVAAAAAPGAVAAAGGRQKFVAAQCAALSSNLRGTTKEFLDYSIPLWSMAEDLAYAAALYDGDTVDVWADVFSSCQGGDATALGYATAYSYLSGNTKASGITLIYEEAVRRRGCGSVAVALDVAAALVVGHRAEDDLKAVVTGYSGAVGACVPAKCCIKARTLPNPPPQGKKLTTGRR